MHTKQTKNLLQFKETKQASKLESKVARTLALSDQEIFLKAMINMIRALMEKVSKVQKQMDYVSGEMESLRIKKQCQRSQTRQQK